MKKRKLHQVKNAINLLRSITRRKPLRSDPEAAKATWKCTPLRRENIALSWEVGLNTAARADSEGAGMDEEIFAIMAPNSEDAITKSIPTLNNTENAMITENIFILFFDMISFCQCRGCFFWDNVHINYAKTNSPLFVNSDNNIPSITIKNKSYQVTKLWYGWSCRYLHKIYIPRMW